MTPAASISATRFYSGLASAKVFRDVRAFFGLASYYRKFVQNFASIVLCRL